MKPTTQTRRRLAATIAALGTAGASLLAGIPSAHASTVSPAPNGGVFPIFTEPSGFTGNPANALSAGWWGHEGPNRGVRPTAFSVDATDGGNAVASAFQLADAEHAGTDIGVAFVPTSATGTANERPTIAAGTLAGQAFNWFIDTPVTGAVAGDNAGDGVTIVHTQTGWNNWVSDGQPNELIENKTSTGGADLEVHNPLKAGDPIASKPSGTSILNTWPAGTKVSMVFFAIESLDASGEPIVKRGSDGRAITAWRTFTTTADPTRTAATSAGYATVGVVVKPTVKLVNAWSGSTNTLTATVTNDGVTAPDATGTVQFVAQAANNSTGNFNAVGSPVPVTGGVATLAVTDLASGSYRRFEAIYTPDSAASETYSVSDPSTPTTVTTPQVVVVTPPAPAPAAVSASIAGKFKKGKKGKPGTYQVSVTAPGVVATGKVTIKLTPKKGKALTKAVALSKGVATIKLTKKLKGKIKAVITYPGAAQINPASKSLSFKAK